ncbi:hypothetical protein GCM10010458_32710 [Microbacterium luteolum]|uniref:Uncharacterized protein n=1 Tax=Microbacterium luteolum TaxID=69367 RepID=A0ABY7XJ96_MICLT|nr:hypothetical protein [Microbacterium luteolum]WDM42164.1 hypothetical protein KV395_02270 [Microbacterium luteolum]
MPQTLTQRLTLVLPLVGVALLLASMILPEQFAFVAWGLAMVAFVTALACAIIAQRESASEHRRVRSR